MGIKENLEKVLERIERAAERAGRDPKQIRLVAVAKTFPPDVIRQAYELGLRDFGENRAQELREKYEALKDLDITWHFIGRIQTNKVKYFVRIADYVHSVWREEEMREIEKRASKIGKVMKVFIEVNVSGEETKAGVRPEEVRNLLEIAQGFEHIEVIGLMTMAPFVEDPEEVRWVFRRLRELRDEISRDFPKVKELSMGMSNDFEVAIEEGATFVRIGTAIFGRRRE